jgi:hypothetical protein
MDFAEIEKRTGLSQRRLCYTLEHDFFGVGARKGQWWRKASSGRGNVRKFEPFEAFAICCVGMMLEAGLHRAVVKDCMSRIDASESGESKNLLLRAFHSNGVALLEIGARKHYRFRSDGSFPAGKFDTDWRCLATGKKGHNYRPYVRVSIDITKLREDLKG